MSLDNAILSFLNYAPMSGYDLKKYIDESINHFWTATQSHIYRALKEMEKKGWITHETVEQEKRPDRKVYSITLEGVNHLQTWLKTPLPLNDLREAWLIQIFFSHYLSNLEIETLLTARLESVKQKLENLKLDAQDALDRNTRNIGVPRAGALWQMTLDYGVCMYQAEIAWLENTINKTKLLPPLAFPEPSKEN